ncbi:MAG: FHA domain-containing protein [Verrucomicrobiota bacterium]
MNSREQVLEKLKMLGNESNDEGILYLHEGHYNGVIYIKNGYVRYCYAENNYGAREEGFHSLLRILALQSPEWHWESCTLPGEKTIKIPIERVLECVEIMSKKRNEQLTTKTTRLELPRKAQIDLTKVRIYLNVDKGALEGEKLPLQPDKTTVGRGFDCAIRLPDPTVSTKHCHFIIQDHTIYLEDLDSFNGTRINNVRIQKYAVSFDDLIEIGETKVHLSYQDNKVSMEDNDLGGDSLNQGLGDTNAEKESNLTDAENRINIQRKLRQVTRVVDRQSHPEGITEKSDSSVNENSDITEAPSEGRIAKQRKLRQMTRVVEKVI